MCNKLAIVKNVQIKITILKKQPIIDIVIAWN